MALQYNKITQPLINDLPSLNKQLVLLCNEIESNFKQSLDSLFNRNNDLAHKTINAMPLIDEMEIAIEQECLRLLFIHNNPVNLRYLVAILRINQHLEDIARLSKNIAQSTIILNEYDPIHIPSTLTEMADITKNMVYQSLNTLVNLNKIDIKDAYAIIKTDDYVDNLHQSIYHTMAVLIQDNTNQAETAMEWTSISKMLERIADACTNIIENLLFIAEGKVIRHPNKIE